MKIVVINGTQNRGCTYKMKDMFLEALGDGHVVQEYHLPQDAPVFCSGCKVCFYNDISTCPHSQYTVPIWQSMQESDLIVFASPTYVFHTTGQIKALLDHYGSKWMAHSPTSQMFSKKAVIITNAAGQGMNNVIKDIGDSLDYWGIAKRYAIKQALFSAEWQTVSNKRKENIKKQCQAVAKKVKQPIEKPRLKIRLIFSMMGFVHKMMNKDLIKKGQPPSRDYSHWKENGWLNGHKPWKKRHNTNKKRAF